MMIYLYTDGSVTKPKEGRSPGGWAFCYSIDDQMFKGSGGVLNTTNNQMEMVAVMKGFQSLIDNGYKGKSVVVVSDSQYVINGCSIYLPDWKRMGWANKSGKPIKNPDYWKRLDKLASNFKTRWKWIRGHNGHPFNEQCDVMAKAAAFRALGMLEAAS